LKFYLFLINASSLYTTGYALTREEARATVSNLVWSQKVGISHFINIFWNSY